MSHCLNIDVHGEQLWLLGDKALYWPARRVMLVADVHIGKAAAFRAQHLPVPRGTTQSTLQRLDRLLTSYPCEELIVLGDFLHARTGRAAATLERVRQWRERHARLKITLIRGNHDLHAGDPPEGLRTSVVICAAFRAATSAARPVPRRSPPRWSIACSGWWSSPAPMA